MVREEMSALEKAKAMADKAKLGSWPDGFSDNFMIVVKHYECSDDEIQVMKSVARKDMINADICFKEMVNEIRGVPVLQQPA